ncbi:hypothetical protein ACMXYO_08695 [Neptuniibacter sp. QD37_6]|uniref:hypothetical protein n=1 Tax=Neptuniibacter sp. QD37_6 TaxID=3398210 RepID=UPI0039F5E170
MGFCIELNDKEAIGRSEEFEALLIEFGLLSDWDDYKASLFRGASNYGPESMGANARRYCHLRGIALLLGSQVFMSCVPKRSGHVARYPVLEATLLHLRLKEEWDEYFMGSAFVLLDNDGTREPDNWGIYWHDVERFYSQRGLILKPLLESELPIDALLNVVRGNLKLSNLHLSDEQIDIARLATHGLISNKEALERIKILRPS